MSRVGKSPIELPSGVEVKVSGNVVSVKGPKGTLTQEIQPSMSVDIDDGTVTVSRENDERQVRALHGLTRSLIKPAYTDPAAPIAMAPNAARLARRSDENASL